MKSANRSIEEWILDFVHIRPYADTLRAAVLGRLKPHVESPLWSDSRLVISWSTSDCLKDIRIEANGSSLRFDHRYKTYSITTYTGRSAFWNLNSKHQAWLIRILTASCPWAARSGSKLAHSQKRAAR